MLDQLLQINKLFYFLTLVFLQVLFFYLFQTTFFLNERVFLNSYADVMTNERISELLQIAKQYSWVSLVLLPAITLIKIIFNAFILTTGTLLSNDSYNFSKNFNVCLKAEIVFIVLIVCKIIVFTFFLDVQNLKEINYIPLSLANIFDMDTAYKWSIYPLQTFNVWEFLFCFIGTKLFSIQYRVNMHTAFRFFGISYLANIFIIVIISIFFSISLS